MSDESTIFVKDTKKQAARLVNCPGSNAWKLQGSGEGAIQTNYICPSAPAQVREAFVQNVMLLWCMNYFQGDCY